jgi:hypothetical protein
MRFAVIVVVALLAGCADGAATSSPTQAPATATSPASPPPVSVVCEVYQQPADDIREAFQRELEGGNATVQLRAAITGLEAIAGRAENPEEKEDILALANALDDAAISGESWIAHWDPFYVKYAKQCGAEVAPD